MASSQQPVLLAPKIPLVGAKGLMTQEWYSFLAAKLKLLGTSNTSIDDVSTLLGTSEEVPFAIATEALQRAEDNAVLLAFAG